MLSEKKMEEELQKMKTNCLNAALAARCSRRIIPKKGIFAVLSVSMPLSQQDALGEHHQP